MLSRAAERVYWSGRYLERAENTARIVQQYSQLFLDLPEEVGVGWTELVEIFGAADTFAARGEEGTEAGVIRFLVSDLSSPSSLAHSVRQARDNIRNTRDLLSLESWESVNELNQFASHELTAAMAGEDRFEALSQCIVRCQQINGILTGTMSHNSPFQFLRLGQNLERADMTSRIIDVATAYIRHNERLVLRYGSSLWTNVLKSVSGFQMYRQYCQPQVEGFRVIEFLMRDRAFPRAMAACIERAGFACRALPRNEATLSALDSVAALLEPLRDEQMTATDTSVLMDRVQTQLAQVHGAVSRTWFLAGDQQ